MSNDDAPKNKFADYSYAAMSNLVTKADRRVLPKQGETTGEPDTLAGRASVREMGSRARAPTTEKPQAARQTIRAGASQKRKQESQYGYSSILDATAGLEGLVYRPSTTENREVFDSLLALVSQLLGDQSQDIIRSAGDLILEVLKNSQTKELDKKREIESAVGSTLTEGDFLRLGQLSRRITDFDRDEDKQAMNDDETTLDEETGVAVIMNEEEDGDESDDDENGSVTDGSQYEEAEIDDENGNDDADNIISAGQARTEDKDKVNVSEIDSFWLQRKIASEYPSHADAHMTQEKADSAYALLSSPISLGMLENDLMDLFEYDKFQLVQILVKNRQSIVWCTKLARSSSSEETNRIRSDIQNQGLTELLRELDGTAEVSEETKASSDLRPMEVDDSIPQKPLKTVDLEDLAFTQGNHLMSNKKVSLPEGSFKRSHASYEEVHVPAPKKADVTNDIRVPITDMPDWTHAAFGNTVELNRIQSRMFPTAFGSDENVLLCAPTGAGKTNVAMLTILHEISKHRDEDTGVIRLGDFKIVYIAPLKALVSEMVGNFSSRLASYGIQVSELTGDSQLTKRQIADTQIIVTTPEKWDVITRKATDTSYTTLVRLLIIDEIHLLHDDRGPVLESIVSRIHRKMEQGAEGTRLVGLSATLPNYTDVATFLRVDPDKGIFYFDQSYRPCPLKQEFIGITEKKPIKKLQVMNTVCYEKVLETVSKQNQVLVFVHSRKETYKTARFIRDQALENDTIQRILKSDAASREILTREAEAVKDAGLRELLPYGLAMHHAGMSKADRTTAEDLFAEGLVQVLVSTATLAWGVNLPAHTVIIKGTQIYSPEKGTWVELSPQDVLQMLGRAGRPQYDTYGEGIIITNQTEMQYYLSLINQQLPIESQFVSRLADNMNAEIALNTIKSRDDGVDWLGYTYLYIRMLHSPILYKVGAEYADDPTLQQKRIDLVHSAATLLAKCNLIKYDINTGAFQSTELGRIASHYYVTHSSMKTYNTHLKPNLTFIELFRVFSLSDEFKYIPVREDEKLEMAKILERVPVPVRESPDEPACKINVLLQAYISRLKLDGFALVADMVYVTQSAGRIIRSIFEICLKRGWSQVARLALDMCKMVERSLWSTRSPLAQFRECPTDVLRKLERREFAWSRYFDLDPQEVGELTGDSRSGRLVHRLVHQFPRLQVNANVQPITRSLLRVELTITPDFEWNDDVHGGAEMFWIIAEDVDGEHVLFHDQFILNKRYAQEDHTVDFTVPIAEPIPPHYFVSLVSDRWLHAEYKVAIPFRYMTLPEKFPAHTPLLDLQHAPVSNLKNDTFQSIFDFEYFNRVQTQTFHTLYDTDESTFIGAAAGWGKTTCAELSLLRHWSSESRGRAVYISPLQELVDNVYIQWSQRLKPLEKVIVKLVGEMSENIKMLQSADLILATADQWEELTRRWKQRKAVQTLSLLIADDLHLVGGHLGANYEIAISRTRYISAQTENDTRIVALSSPLADPRDIREWIGASAQAVFNFQPSHRAVPLEIHLQSYNVPHFPSLMMAMAKPAYLALSAMASDGQALVYVVNRKQCRDTALDLLLAATAAGEENKFLLSPLEDVAKVVADIEEQSLCESVTHGIGYLHEALSTADRRIVTGLYQAGAIQVLLVSRDCAYAVDLRSSLIIIMGTQSYEGSQHRYIDYPVSDLLRMLGRSAISSHGTTAKAIVMTPAAKRDYYKKFLDEALPIESQFPAIIHDNFITEISTQTIESKQEAVDWITWTLFYRRLAANPAYYGLEDISHDQLSSFLSDLVENTLNDLVEAKIVEIGEDEMELTIMNLGLIGAHYAISYITMQTFALSLTQRTKLKRLLEIVTSATEYDNVPVRRHEDIVLKRLYDRLPVKLDINFESPHHKAFILLQAHFARIALPADLRTDQATILRTITKLLSACVDVMSSEGFLNTINAMELSQMCVQAQWDHDSPLKQIPHFDAAVLARCRDAGVDEVPQIAELEDAQREDLLRMTPRQLNAVARFCNGYPDIELLHDLVGGGGSLRTGEPAVLKVQLNREVDADEAVDTTVMAAHYPHKKVEHWWLVLSDATALLAIKKVTVQRTLTVSLEFVPGTLGSQDLTLSFMSDSYVGVDQEQTIPVDVTQGEGGEADVMEE
ncbi:protein of unknown function [Taphrina deformans PYCC 5710]|uniref:RNA helicase n=1 Tax=Taphrina deformans (strain PYCC 5710 / ATCC 11124 / CBS 356.35 / IMI 108563 / JCM 9778 / NBRC 8474) TaxID=1097556 RepID=R4XDT8_TAPDE|nr:protein of unknown function [Taphrina deformans PYCC 5710]|eukprot:CCG83995.1 protein of unknown function [Taphrina deformans PYCC 5710]